MIVRDRIISGILSLIAICLIVIPYKNFLSNKLIVRKFSRPEFSEGLIEICVIFIGFVLVHFLLKEKKKAVLLTILGITALYLRRHQVLVPFCTAILFIEILFLLGRFISSIFSLKESSALSYLLGLLGWTSLALVLSLLNLGTINVLRTVFFLLGILLIGFSYISKKSLTDLHCVSLLSYVTAQPIGYRILSSLIFCFLAVLAAKTNTHIDWDSLSYGLRPEYVLLGDHSFFDPLYLVGDTIYYPKLHELISLPLAGFNDYSFLLCLNVALFSLLIIYFVQSLNKLSSNKTNNLLFAFTISSIPAIAVMATSAKPDMHSAFLFLLAIYFTIEFSINKKISSFFLSIIAMGLSASAKITGFAFGPFLGLGLLLILFVKWKRNQLDLGASKKQLSLLALLFIIPFIGIHFRTYHLTGYPLIKFTSLWEKLGFHLNIYKSGGSASYINLKNDSFYNYIEFFKDAFFLPFNLKGHLGVSWFSDIIPFMIIAVLILGIGKLLLKNKNHEIVQALGFLSLSGIIVFISFYARPNPGGDGNYYIIPILAVAVLLYYIVNAKAKNILRLPLIIYLVFHLFLVFLIDMSWHTGTAKFDLDFTKPVIESPTYKSTSLEYNKLNTFNEALIGSNKIFNSITFGVNRKAANYLSARNQSYGHLAAWGGATFHDPDKILSYIQQAAIDFILIETSSYEKYEHVLSSILAQKYSMKSFANYDIFIINDEINKLIE